MSMDILAGAGGRVASLAKNASAPNAKNGGADQDMSDPAKLFGALLEKPQSKETEPSGKDDESATQENDVVSAEASRQSPLYFVPQPLFSLATDISAGANGDASLLDDGGHKAPMSLNAQPVLADGTDEAEQAQSMLSEKSALVADVAKKPAPTAPIDNKSADTNKARSENRPDVRSNQDAASTLGVPAEPAFTSDEGTVGGSSGDGGNGTERMSAQPQQPASRGSVLVEAKPAIVASQASVRINDIQIISERSFGAVKTLQIRLDPVELGAVTARIRVVADTIEVHLIADKAHGAEALTADRSMIEKALKVAGVTEDSKITVTVTERGAVNAQQSTSSQSAGQQQAGQQQQGQQGFGMQNGTDGRNGSQGQAQFMGGEGRQNGQSAQTQQGFFDTHGANGEASQEISGAGSTRNRGLVV